MIENGTNLISISEWQSSKLQKKCRNCKGGSNNQNLNKLLIHFGIRISESEVYLGNFNINDEYGLFNKQIGFEYGTKIVEFPQNGYLIGFQLQN